MDTHDAIQSEYEVNRMMITKYFKKHYQIHKIYLMNRDKPVSVKNPLKFETLELEKNQDVNTYLLAKLIGKIFSVDDGFVLKLIRDLALEELDILQKARLDLFSAFAYTIQHE